MAVSTTMATSMIRLRPASLGRLQESVASPSRTFCASVCTMTSFKKKPPGTGLGVKQGLSESNPGSPSPRLQIPFLKTALRLQRPGMKGKELSRLSAKGEEVAGNPDPPSLDAWTPNYDHYGVAFCLLLTIAMAMARGAFGEMGVLSDLLYVYVAIISGFGAVSIFGHVLPKCEANAQRGVHVQPRNKQLPPEWHNLYHLGLKRVFYYKSATGAKQWEQPPLLDSRPGMRISSHMSAYIVQGILQQIVSVAKPVTIVAVYGGFLVKSFLALLVLIKVSCDSGWPIAILLSASFAALPQPLPFLIYYVSNLAKPIAILFHPSLKVALCVALFGSLLPIVVSYYQTMRRAAQAKLGYCDLSWDLESCWRLLCAVLPPLNWKLQPYAFSLDLSRVCFVALPHGGVPWPVPVPKWEQLGASWMGLFSAATLVIPMVQLLAINRLNPPLFWSEVRHCLLFSKPVLVGVLVSVIGLVLRRQRDAYASALQRAESNESDGKLVVEEIEERMLRDFDERLG